jgi:putative methionine-R-sulfoxide reductase with GAF domain
MEKSWWRRLGREVGGWYRRAVNDDPKVPTEQEKRGFYAEAGQRIAGLVAGEPDRIARMAGIVAVLHGLLPHLH